MNLRVFKVKFRKMQGVQQNRINRIIRNLQKSKRAYVQETNTHNKDIAVSASNKVDSRTGTEYKEAESKFSHTLDGVTAYKDISPVIKLKFYTDKLGIGMDYSHINYGRRHCVAKTHPKFHEVLCLYVSSMNQGVLFAPCKRPTKVNDLLRRKVGNLLMIDSFEEVRFEGQTFEKILKSLFSSDNVEYVNFIGAKIKDKDMGKCFMGLDVRYKKSYQAYKDFKAKYDKFELKRVTFTTKLSGDRDEKEMKVTLQAEDRCPLVISLRTAATWYTKLFSWLGDVFIEV